MSGDAAGRSACATLRVKQARGRGGALLVGGDQLVPLGVGMGVDLLARGGGIEPGQGAANAFRERHGGAVAGNEALDLAVVEDHADGLVAFPQLPCACTLSTEVL